MVKGRSLEYVLANERPFIFGLYQLFIDLIYCIKSYKGRLGFLPW